jgi:hypothetical protein
VPIHIGIMPCGYLEEVSAGDASFFVRFNHPNHQTTCDGR